MESKDRKPAIFIPPTLKEFGALPEDVEDVFGSAMLDAQYGDFPLGASPFGEGLPTQILKLSEDYNGVTFRLSFWLGCGPVVYVLGTFKKKSKSGIRTPQADIDRIRTRFKRAKEECDEKYDQKKK